MPNPHFSVQVISRKQGQSIVAAAAYRSGETLYDERAGKTFDYTRKEDVMHAEIMRPDGVPLWTGERAALWNQVEANEKRKDAQLARNIIAALPRELDTAQNLALVRGYVQENFVAKGMIADFAIHESDAGDGLKNPHVHILLTLRSIGPDGFGQKNRHWNATNTLNGWRDSWEAHTNQHLELAGREERVSLRSYEAQGKNKRPQVHLGEEIGNLEKKGVETKKGDYNRKIQHENALIEMFYPEAGEQEFEHEGDGLSDDLEHQTPETERSSQQAQAWSKFLSADPTMRLEALTLELQDDMAEESKTDSGSGPCGDKEATLNTFKNDNEDTPEKLAQASLEASRAVHDAALREYLQSPAYQNTGAKRYMERMKAFGEKVYQQFTNLIKGTERPGERDKTDYER